MAMPKVLDWLDELVAKVATNTANIAKNASDIAENKKLFDTHVADDERHWTTEDRNNFDRVVHFKGYFVSIEKLKEAYPTGQLGDYAIVGGTDTVWLWDDESNSWLNSTEQGIVISVNGRTGEVILTKTDVGLSNVDNTADKDKPISTAQQTALNAKADRKKITLAQADSLGLRAGIYYIDNESKKINDFTASYWTVIVAERSTGTNASATQIWMNYNSNSTQHIYMRKQQNGSSWSEFREILTDIHYSELDTKIQTNIEDIGDLQVNKANRGQITLEKANSVQGLNSGIYYIVNQTTTILDITSSYWTVIQGDWSDEGKGAVQIWMPYQTGVETSILWRHQKKDSNNVISWGDFVKVGTADDISSLQNQITTNKNNIATNKTNITKNTNDITTLKEDRAERKKISISDAESHTLKAGIYNIEGESKTILEETSQFWTVIIGHYRNENLGKDVSVTQIWMPFEDNPNGVPKMFIRRSLSSSVWSDFVEVLTTNIASREDINRFKQYKGYYSLLSELKTAYPTATDGDYAIVGSSLYIWNSKVNNWNEVSGSGGGSTGTGKWSIKQYNAPDWTTSEAKYLKDIRGLELEKQSEIDDTDGSLIDGSVEVGANKGLLFETFVNMQQETTIDTSLLRHDDAVSIYINGELVFEQDGTGTDQSASFTFVQGWNKIQIVLSNTSQGASLRLGVKILSNVNCLSMDCYHNYDTIVDNAYVPYVGDSTIEGNVVVEGTVGVTSKSYLQYNEDDDSLSFMFSNQIKE